VQAYESAPLQLSLRYLHLPFDLLLRPVVVPKTNKNKINKLQARAIATDLYTDTEIITKE
jgi:hypothetical protein